MTLGSEKHSFLPLIGGESCRTVLSSVTLYKVLQTSRKYIQLGAQFRLIYLFIYFSSLHVSGIHVPIIRRKSLYLCDTGIFHSVWVASGLLVGLISIQPADQTPPIRR